MATAEQITEQNGSQATARKEQQMTWCVSKQGTKIESVILKWAGPSKKVRNRKNHSHQYNKIKRELTSMINCKFKAIYQE